MLPTFSPFPQCFEKASFQCHYYVNNLSYLNGHKYSSDQRSGAEFTNHSLERSLSSTPDFSIFFFFEAFKCNTTSDWLWFSQSNFMLHSDLRILKKKDKEC